MFLGGGGAFRPVFLHPRVFDAATLAWVAAVGAANVTATRKDLIDNLIVGLKGDGIFSKLDRLWLFAAENTASALRDLVGTNLATSTAAFQIDRGYTGDGSSTFVDTTFIPPGTNYLQDSASIGIWAVTVGTGPGGQLHGWRSAGNVSGGHVSVHFNGTTELDGCANTAGAAQQSATATPTKFGMANRSGTNAVQLYSDGTQTGTDTPASDVLTGAVSFYVCARNSNGAFNSPSDEQIACASMGGSLTSAEAGNLWTRLRTYMTAVGVP